MVTCQTHSRHTTVREYITHIHSIALWILYDLILLRVVFFTLTHHIESHGRGRSLVVSIQLLTVYQKNDFTKLSYGINGMCVFFTSVYYFPFHIMWIMCIINPYVRRNSVVDIFPHRQVLILCWFCFFFCFLYIHFGSSVDNCEHYAHLGTWDAKSFANSYSHHIQWNWDTRMCVNCCH